MNETLINKYRPKSFDEVIGHEAAVKAIQKALKRKTARAFLLTGPAGLGKTTLARLIASEVGCEDRQEIDAATNTGIEDMRKVTSELMYAPLGGEAKVIIVDEAHALSKAATQSLLKILEEPPPYVYWVLCTTEGTRILPTIKTRCVQINLKPLPVKTLVGLLRSVAKQEKIKVPDEVLDVCAEEAQGSPRQALSYLATVADCADADEAAELIGAGGTNVAAIDLARALLKKARWSDIQKLLKGLKETDSESTRRVMQAYFATVAVGAKSEDSAAEVLALLEHFNQPFSTYGQLVMACGMARLSD